MIEVLETLRAYFEHVRQTAADILDERKFFDVDPAEYAKEQCRLAGNLSKSITAEIARLQTESDTADAAELLAEVREWDGTLADGLDRMDTGYETDDDDDPPLACGCLRVIRDALVCGAIKAHANPFAVYDGPVCDCACHRVVEGLASDAE